MPSTRPSNAASTSQPAFERRRLAHISGASQFNALSDLAKDEGARNDILVSDRRIPGRHMWVATRALPDLGNDVGIDQVVHRSTLRPGSRLRSRSIPSSGVEASSAIRLTLGGSTKP